MSLDILVLIKMGIKITEMNSPDKWDHYFMNLAKLSAGMSKDPSTRVGAAIRAPDKSVLSTGYNGFPPDISDDPELLNNRELKYKYVIHAECNAINYALRHGISDNCIIYTTLMPCLECYKLISINNIKKIVTLYPTEDHINRYSEQWNKVLELAELDNCSINFII